ncbi:MAG: hypothetical protein IJ274_00050 [Lachnospiraceae bacterium]|nr:hypothetical protein [Lachnospiraceae bacterium]
MRGEIKTEEGFGEIEATYHQTILYALNEALRRFHAPAEITVYSRDAYVIANIMKMEEMQGAGFKDKKGQDIKNAEEWEKICKKAEKHEIEGVTGKHEFSTVLQDDMKRGDFHERVRRCMEKLAKLKS